MSSPCHTLRLRFPHLTLALLGALLLCACRSTSRLELRYEPPPADNHGNKRLVHVVTVVDARDPVGTPAPTHLGELEQGTSIEGDRSLHRALERGLRDELEALGFRCPRDERQVQLAVTIHEWRWTEDGKDAWFRCALDVAVLAPLASRVRDRARVTYERHVTGSPLSGAWTALNEAHHEIFAEVIQRCLRNNRVVLEALSGVR
jgi:uncharacterized lipoprotein YajG